MANRKHKNKALRDLTRVILVLVLLMLGALEYLDQNKTTDTASTVPQQTTNTDKTEPDKNQPDENLPDKTPLMKVHFIDVGQGDCILIQTADGAMLIDSGERQEGEKVAAYIKQLGITKLSYVVGTHPHTDHIGSMSQIVDQFDIDTIIMPKVAKKVTTSDYKKLLTSIDQKQLTIQSPKVGDQFSLGGVAFTVLSPKDAEYEDLNNYSCVLRAVYGHTSFLFTGDAEKLAEDEMLADGLDVSANVLKAGHHGSHTSTSQKFLDAVNPSIAVIQCGRDNDYGHPHKEVMDRLTKKDVKIYRTDTDGTIVLTSDGTNITAETSGV